MPLRVRVTCAGVAIGTAEFAFPEGLAHAQLAPAPAYGSIADAARLCGLALAQRQFFPSSHGDFAVQFAAAWSGDRLALEDELGRELAVNSIVVVEKPWTTVADVRVVADFRPDLARAEALLPLLDPDDWDRTKPAA